MEGQRLSGPTHMRFREWSYSETERRKVVARSQGMYGVGSRLTGMEFVLQDESVPAVVAAQQRDCI